MRPRTAAAAHEKAADIIKARGGDVTPHAVAAATHTARALKAERAAKGEKKGETIPTMRGGKSYEMTVPANEKRPGGDDRAAKVERAWEASSKASTSTGKGHDAAADAHRVAADAHRAAGNAAAAKVHDDARAAHEKIARHPTGIARPANPSRGGGGDEYARDENGRFASK